MVQTANNLTLNTVSAESEYYSSTGTGTSQPSVVPVYSFSKPAAQDSQTQVSSLVHNMSLLVTFASGEVGGASNGRRPGEVLCVGLVLLNVE